MLDVRDAATGGQKLAVKHTTRYARALVKELQYRLDVNTLHREPDAEALHLNDIGRVRLRTTLPLFCDEYRRNRTTGGFVLIDEATNRTVGAGDGQLAGGRLMEIGLALGGLAVGFVVGLTGMGGGALMTPMLVFFFGVNPLAAVSSDLVTSAIMKPFGGAVHAHRGTVNRALVGWLALGSVPSAFLGVFVLRALGSATAVDDVVTTALGMALVVAALALIAKALRLAVPRCPASGKSRDRRRRRPGSVAPRRATVSTVLTGVVGGLVVGMTSVGSGSLMIIALMTFCILGCRHRSSWGRT